MKPQNKAIEKYKRKASAFYPEQCQFHGDYIICNIFPKKNKHNYRTVLIHNCPQTWQFKFADIVRGVNAVSFAPLVEQLQILSTVIQEVDSLLKEVGDFTSRFDMKTVEVIHGMPDKFGLKKFEIPIMEFLQGFKEILLDSLKNVAQLCERVSERGLL